MHRRRRPQAGKSPRPPISACSAARSTRRSHCCSWPKSEAGSDSYVFIIAAKQLPPPGNQTAGVEILLEGRGKTIKGYPQGGTIGANLQALQFGLIDGPDFAFIGKASALRLKYDGKIYGPFALPDVADAVAALKDCLGEQLVALGADPVQFKPGGSAPEPRKPRLDFLTFDQVSRVMSVMKKDSDVKFKLTIDASGAVAACARLAEPHGDRIEKMVCGLLAGKTLFQAVHDPAGKPVVGIATYEMPILRKVYYSSPTPLP